MLCYLDRAFCMHSYCLTGKCTNFDCYRNYTPNNKLRNDATVSLPISVSDFKDDDCGYEEIENGS